MLCDVMKEGISKAYALQKLSESLGIKRKEIIAIGDHYNDIDLIDDFVLNDMINTADIVHKAA
jgi:HAD superfamily hydrolase (TIGR01484 family)